jgi:pimeloyl-ACP methyl ester carboxylesterase
VVPGLAHTAASTTRFAEAVLAARGPGPDVCAVYAIDLPGHGSSSLPTGLLFGDLDVEDHAAAVRQVLAALDARHVRIDTVVGHSMGGLIVQVLQAGLLAEGGSLREDFGVRHAVTLASSPPAEVRALACGGGGPGADLSGLAQFVLASPTLGGYLALPELIWRALFFSDRQGALVPTAPDLAAVLAMSSIDSLAALLQVVDLPPLGAPSVPAGLFDGSGTDLTVVAFAEDPLGDVDGQRCLYEHLTGDDTDEGLVVFDGPLAVHDAHVAAPSDLVQALEDSGRVRW